MKKLGVCSEHLPASSLRSRHGPRQARDLAPDEQHALDHGYLRLLTFTEEIARCDQAIADHHYLHDVTLVGEHLR